MQIVLDKRQMLLRHERQWEAYHSPVGNQCFDQDWVERMVERNGERRRAGVEARRTRWLGDVEALRPQRKQALREYGDACQEWLHFIDSNLEQLPNSYCGMTIQVEVRQGGNLPVLRMDVGHRFRTGFAEALSILDEVHMPAYALQGRQLPMPDGGQAPVL